jgi:hypothetical protein
MFLAMTKEMLWDIARCILPGFIRYQFDSAAHAQLVRHRQIPPDCAH